MMLLKTFRLLPLVALLFAGHAFAEPYLAGKHYSVIAEEPTAEPVVMEFFSYGCPHCYTFQPFMEQLATSVADAAEIQYVPVDFGGGYWSPTQELYLVLEALGRREELHLKVFEAIHDEGRFINSSSDARAFAVRHGIAKEEYGKAAKSFAAHVKKQRYDQLTKRFRISGTPTVIVNGKYRVELPALRSAEDFVALVKFLLENP